jgi:hypothetical protein
MSYTKYLLHQESVLSDWFESQKLRTDDPTVWKGEKVISSEFN